MKAVSRGLEAEYTWACVCGARPGLVWPGEIGASLSLNRHMIDFHGFFEASY